jgi:hypothetical protein
LAGGACDYPGSWQTKTGTQSWSPQQCLCSSAVRRMSGMDSIASLRHVGRHNELCHPPCFA